MFSQHSDGGFHQVVNVLEQERMIEKKEDSRSVNRPHVYEIFGHASGYTIFSKLLTTEQRELSLAPRAHISQVS